MTEAFNIDCMDAMAQMKNNEFDLAIVDPPYGIGLDGGQIGYSKHEKKDWDSSCPDKEWFSELFRVSENQIIWGFNHFLEMLPSTKAIIFWNKHQNGYFAEGELAWCNLGTVKYYDRAYQIDIGNKIHPTQKPIALYKWLLKNYAKEGDRILDTHLGSGSSRIAAYDMGFDFVGYEIDKDYFKAQEKRFENHIQQKSMFEPNEMY